MRRSRAGAALLGFYALTLIANAAFYASWSGDISGLTPRFWMRLLFVAGLIYGLWQTAAWARWLTIVFGFVLGLAGLFGVWAAHQVGLFNDRLYPAVDYSALVVTSVLLIGAAIVLIWPAKSRDEPPAPGNA